MSNARFSRRSMLALTGAAVSAPLVVPSSVFGAGAPSNRLTVGHIGVGGKGSDHLRAHAANPQVQVLAVCDVDYGRRQAARQAVEAAGSAASRNGAYRSCAEYEDYRVLLERQDIDAVVVATPDHWHAPICIAAAKAGKDIYCEKPLTLTVAEGPVVVDAVRRYGRVLQTGSQERSGGGSRYACELVRNGRLGKLREIEIGLPASRSDVGPQREMPVPRGFNYDMWLGPAPWAPYTRARCHGSFRYIFDYSGGEMTDRGAHVADIALWGADQWIRGRADVEPIGRAEFYSGSLFNTAVRYNVEWRFDNGLRMLVSSERPRGVKFIGSEGWVFVAIHGGSLSASNPALLREPIGETEVRLLRSRRGHREDWHEAVRTRGPVVAPVEEGARTATFCHLCNISLLLGRRVRWDWDAYRFAGDAEADRLLWRPGRAPWCT